MQSSCDKTDNTVAKVRGLPRQFAKKEEKTISLLKYPLDGLKEENPGFYLNRPRIFKHKGFARQKKASFYF